MSPVNCSSSQTNSTVSEVSLKGESRDGSKNPQVCVWDYTQLSKELTSSFSLLYCADSGNAEHQNDVQLQTAD